MKKLFFAAFTISNTYATETSIVTPERVAALRGIREASPPEEWAKLTPYLATCLLEAVDPYAIKRKRKPTSKYQRNPKIGKYTCKECGFTPARNIASELARHMNSHTKNVAYACSVAGCLYTTYWRSNVARHKRKHAQ